MKTEKIKPLIKGIIIHMPGVKKILTQKTRGTTESRYCYSVWMRHLTNWYTVKKRIPEVVAELGPGDSLGIGLAALLSGSKQIYTLDVVKYWDTKQNLKIFNELVELFKNKSDIPNNTEYPKVKPLLENYDFPTYILSDSRLNETLNEERLESIRKEILDIDNPNNSFIKCYIPWEDSNIIKPESVDFIYSQAVLEHVEDLEKTYNAMHKWLKTDGLMSHDIDFKSHGITNSWNGHWMFSDFEWKIVKGGKKFLINRQPFSRHVELHLKYGFKILKMLPTTLENKLNRKHLSKRFKNLSEEDLTTSSVYILSKKI